MVQTKNATEKVTTKPTDKTGEQPKITDPKNTAIIPEILPEKRPDVNPKLPKKAQPTFAEKLGMLEELNNLVTKRELLNAALKDVADFYIAPAGNCSVRMTDSNNKSFSISHPFVIEEILKQVTFKLEEELDRVETSFEVIF